LQLHERFRESRNESLHVPSLEKELRETQPRLAEMFDAGGGVEHSSQWREAMDTMQDMYFLRKATWAGGGSAPLG
jgi:hypothetical protein